MARPPQPPDERLEQLLDQAEVALGDGEPERALAAAEAALALGPKSADALHCRAAALTALSRTDEAHDAYRAALKAAPDNLEVLRGAIDLLVVDLGEEHDALEDALDLCERALKLARRRGEQELLADFLLLCGMALGKLGQTRQALPPLEEAARLAPGDPEIGLERGIALFTLLRLEDARQALEAVLEQEPREAWAHHYLGLIAERRGDQDAAKRHLRRARTLSPEDFPAPIELSPQEFDRAVHDALEQLPERVRRYLTNVSISVEELPADEDLAGDPPLAPDLLGLFSGPAYTERKTDDPWSHFPSAIVLYQKNLQRSCRSRDELIEQIGITLVHEVGHFLGLSEEELYDRGLD
ncbi:MAG TPA: metallopeptidase family protein [Myxococcales bacterium]